MADDNNSDTDIPVYADVPSGHAIVKSDEEKQALVRRVLGDTPPDECRFHCPMCGWNGTLKFEEGEMEALDHDVTNYVGPCPGDGCGNMTLVPYDKMYDNSVSASHQAKENRRKQYSEQADVFIERASEKVGEIMGGSIFEKGDEEKVTKDHVAASHVPGNRPDLPDAADVDLGDLAGREGSEE